MPDGGAFARDPIPADAGIGLRGPHYRDVMAFPPAVGFLEVHSENFFGRGGVPHSCLESIRRDYPLSFHGVGLSLGSIDPLNRRHLRRLRELIDAYQPDLVSEHLSWGSFGGRYLNDLLPLPYTAEVVEHLADRIRQVQDFLGRRILVENVSCYLEFEHSHLREWEFVVSVAETAGCGVLLDVNNVYVNARNHGYDADGFLAGVPGGLVGEIHLAGHTVKHYPQGDLIIDTHDQRVCDEVWTLYRRAVAAYGPKPTLIEWDANLPELDVLVGEALIARGIMQEGARERVA